MKSYKNFIGYFNSGSCAAPFLELVVNGYEDLMAMLTDVYDNGIIVLLSASILNLYNSEKREDE